MLKKHFLFALALFFSLTKTACASFVIESEPAYDPYRDGYHSYHGAYADGSGHYYPVYRQPTRHYQHHAYHHKPRPPVNFAARLPSHIDTGGEKMVMVNPNVHAWGAYSEKGDLVRGGIASAGSNWCPDLHRRCHTTPGTFRVHSLGDGGCVSRKFPLGRGGAPMPYCMYFNGAFALHGSYELGDANLSHGCVRMKVEDAKWLRFNFVHVGTKVVVKSY